MTKEETAKQFANDIDEFKVAGVLLAAGDVKHVYRIGRYEGFLAGFEAEKSQWHYVKDKKMQKFDEGTEIKFLKGKYTKAKRIVICLCENNNYQNIYAWKEIVLPKEIE